MYTARLTVTEQPTNLVLAITLSVARIVNVLLIDDNADIAQLFDRFVTGTRYCLHHAPSAEHLFEQVTEHAPQAIIIDVMMPGVDGWEIMGRLKQHPRTSKLPIIVCTVLPERDLALALGATDFLPKPVTRSALLEALNRVQGEESTESH